MYSYYQTIYKLLANVSTRKINVRKAFLPEGRYGLSYVVWYLNQLGIWCKKTLFAFLTRSEMISAVATPYSGGYSRACWCRTHHWRNPRPNAGSRDHTVRFLRRYELILPICTYFGLGNTGRQGDKHRAFPSLNLISAPTSS